MRGLRCSGWYRGVTWDKLSILSCMIMLGRREWKIEKKGRRTDEHGWTVLLDAHLKTVAGVGAGIDAVAGDVEVEEVEVWNLVLDDHARRAFNSDGVEPGKHITGINGHVQQ